MLLTRSSPRTSARRNSPSQCAQSTLPSQACSPPGVVESVRLSVTCFRLTRLTTRPKASTVKGNAIRCACRSAYRNVKNGNSLISPDCMIREAFQ